MPDYAVHLKQYHLDKVQKRSTTILISAGYKQTIIISAQFNIAVHLDLLVVVNSSVPHFFLTQYPLAPAPEEQKESEKALESGNLTKGRLQEKKNIYFYKVY